MRDMKMDRKIIAEQHTPGLHAQLQGDGHSTYNSGNSTVNVDTHTGCLRRSTLATAGLRSLGNDTGPDLVFLLADAFENLQCVCWHGCVPVRNR